MNFAVDTNRLSDYFNGKDTSLKPLFQSAAKLYVPIVTVAEYMFGAYRGKRRAYNLENLQNFLALPNVIVLSIEPETAPYYAQLRAYLTANGTPIPVNDLWIAALSVQHDLPLLTRDSDFDYLPQVKRV